MRRLFASALNRSGEVVALARCQAAHHFSASPSVSVRLTASAERDIAHAFEWYKKEREDLGYRFMARVDEAIETISENPNMFAPTIGEARRVLVD